MSTTSPSTLEDVRVGVRPKISALWIAMLVLFAYGDIFGYAWTWPREMNATTVR